MARSHLATHHSVPTYRFADASRLAVVYATQDWKYDRNVAIKALGTELEEIVAAKRLPHEILADGRRPHFTILQVQDPGELGASVECSS